MRSEEYETTFELDNGVEVTVIYTINPFDPGVVSGPPENCYPPEGGDAEVLRVLDSSGGEIAWSAADDEKWRSWIEQNHEWDEGPDPDDAYDRSRDEG